MTTSAPRERNWRRVAGTMGAQVSNQVVTVATQVLLVPVLLHAWGVDRYGAWLLLSAIPTYLTLTDFGFTAIAKNEMTMSVARGERDAALRTYQSVFVLLCGISVLTMAVVAIAADWLHLTALWPLAGTSEVDAGWVLVILSLGVVLFQFMLLGAAGMRALGRPAEEVLWGATARLAEAAFAGAAALMGGDFVAAALAMLAARLLLTAALFVRLFFLARWLRPLGRHLSMSEMSRLLGPSLSYMCYIGGVAVMGQGPVLALGAIGSPRDIVVFSATRTLTRLGVSAANVLTFSLSPEYSRLFGSGDHQRFARFALAGIGLIAGMALIYVGALEWLGGTILAFWTSGEVVAIQPFLRLLLGAVACEMIWSAGFAPLAATNRHVGASHAFLAISLVAVGACFLLPPAFALSGIGIVLFVVNFTMIFVIAWLARRHWRIR